MTTLLKIRKRQGIREPTTEAEWAEYERLKNERREKNVVNAREVLNAHGVQFQESAHIGPDGPIFTVSLQPKDEYGCMQGGCVSFLPAVGRWFDWDMRVHYGVRNLVRYLKGGEL